MDLKTGYHYWKTAPDAVARIEHCLKTVDSERPDSVYHCWKVGVAETSFDSERSDSETVYHCWKVAVVETGFDCERSDSVSQTASLDFTMEH